MYVYIYIYIHLVQPKPNFLQDKNQNLVFPGCTAKPRVSKKNIVFFQGGSKKHCFHMILHHLKRQNIEFNQSYHNHMISSREANRYTVGQIICKCVIDELCPHKCADKVYM